MIYLDNNQSQQDLFIPRQSAKSVSGTTDWASKEYVNSLMDSETARTENTYAKKDELSAYTPTSGFTTINGKQITNGGNITIEGTDWYEGANIKIENNTISVTGIPTNFKTINGSGITGYGNLTIEGKVYSAGTNINIDSANVISVTGITVPTKVSELDNDAGYLTEHQSLSAYSTTDEVEGMVSAATASTTGWVENQHYLTEHQSLTAYTPTSGFSTINGSAITSGGNITVDSSSTVELTQAQYDALAEKEAGTLYVITDAAPIDIDDISSKKLQELSSAPSSPSDGDVVNFEDGVYKYVDGSGQTGFWSETTGNSLTATTTEWGFGLSFSHIPEGQLILEFRRNNNGNWKQFKMERGVLNVYDNSGSTPSTVITKNSGIVRVSSLSSSSYWMEVDYRDNYIGFYKTSTTQLQNIWDGITNVAHYEKVSIPEPLPFINAYFAGLPIWNKRGEVVARGSSITGKYMFFNTTGTSSSYRWDFFYGTYGNTPARMFVPTQSGTEGQVLTSAGNAEPTWQTMIKSVKITSDAYEALATKDPNTLYLIVDE